MKTETTFLQVTDFDGRRAAVCAPDELAIAQLTLTTFHHFREKERCFALGVTSVAGILFRVVT
jgi:hypothetical protein